MKEQIMQLEPGAIATLRASMRLQDRTLVFDEGTGVYYYYGGDFRRVRKSNRCVISIDGDKDGNASYDVYLYKKGDIRCTVGANAIEMAIDGRPLLISIDCSYRVYDLPLFASSMLDRIKRLVKEPAVSRLLIDMICDFVVENGIPGFKGNNISSELEAASVSLIRLLNASPAIAGIGLELTSLRLVGR